MIFLMAYRDTSGLRVDSFRYFSSMEPLVKFIQEHPKGLMPPVYKVPVWFGWHVYKVYNDGTESQPLCLNEYRAIGMRPKRV